MHIVIDYQMLGRLSASVARRRSHNTVWLQFVETFVQRCVRSKLDAFKADSLIVGTAHEKYMDKLHTGGLSEITRNAL